MAHIILSSFGTLGDALPFARLGRALAGRGHRATLLTNYPHRAIVEAHGIGFHSLDNEEESGRFIADGLLSNTVQGQVSLYRKHFLPRVLSEYEAICRLHREGETVVLARATPSVAALFASEKLGVPVLPVFLAPSFHQSMFLVEEMFSSVLSDDINQLRARIGLERVSDWRAWLSSRCEGIGFWPEWFAGVDDSWPKITLTGFIVPCGEEAPPFETLPCEVRQLLCSGDPPVIISGGTGIFAGREWYQACVRACEISGHAAIVSTMHKSQVPSLARKMIWCPQLPFETVCSHARAIIHHGGIGTVGQALHSGIPQLVLGSGSDRPDNARHLIRLGVGGYLPPNQWTPELIARKLSSLLEEDAIEKSRAIAHQHQARSGIEKACQLIEKCLSFKPIFRHQPADCGPLSVNKKMAPGSVTELLSQLSPEKRALLEQRLTQGKYSSKSDSHEVCPQPRREGKNVFPASFVQEQLWLLEELHPGNHAYVSSSAVEVEGPLDLPALEMALNELVRRQEMLRTTFEWRDGGVMQVVHPFSPQKIEIFDSAMSLEAVREQLAQFQSRTMDLKQRPAFRVALVRAEKHRIYLLLCIHHILVDGWAMGVFCEELTVLYAAFIKGAPAPLPPLLVQYADFALRQREQFNGENLDRLLRYWRQQMAGFSLASLPPNPLWQGQRRSSGTQSIRISHRVHSALQQLGREERATLFITILSAFNLLLHWHTGWSDLTVGTDVANRNHPQTRKVIGFFVNQLVLRSRLSAGLPQTFQDYLREVRRTCLEAYAHQDFPFGRLVEALNPNRQCSLSPLFHFKFVLQNVPSMTGLQFLNCTCRSFPISTQEAKFPLLLNFWDSGKELLGSLEFDPAVFSPQRVELLATLLQKLLDEVSSHPGKTLSALNEQLTAWEERVKETALQEMKAGHRETFYRARREPLSIPGVNVKLYENSND
jgi:UDP:flavonoid glycosyltransferase YjiC (YdhE family)